MAKRLKMDIHLLLSHILNRYPGIVENNILDKISKIKTRRALKETLIFMEEHQIIVNPHLYVRNCDGYSNHYMIVKVKNWKDLYERIICRNWEAIDSAFYIRSWKQNRLAYLKYHNTLEREPRDILEEGPIDYFCIIHPQCTTDQQFKNHELKPDKKSQILPDRLNRKFDWDYDTKQVFWWLKVNYRMSLTQIARQIEVSRTTIRRKKRLIEEFSYIHYPTFIHSRPNYTGILSSFSTEYPEFLKKIFQNLSATCYLFGNRDKTLLFINTTHPSYVNTILEELEQRTIVEDLNSEITIKGWNRVDDEYRLGRIPEKFFWMFRRKKRK